MPLTRCHVFALSLALVAAPRLVHAQAPLTLDDALRLAAANNERAAKAPLRVTVAEGQLEKARAGFLPTLTAGGLATIQPVDAKNPRVFTSGASLTLSQPILNLSAFPLYAQALHTLESERWGASQDKRLLAFDTTRAFLLVLTNERLLAAAQGRLDRALADDKNSRQRAGAGLNSSNDVTRSSIEVQSAQREVTTAQGNLERAQIQLAFLIGKPVVGALAVHERTSHAAESTALGGDDARAAEDRRPDVISAKEKTAAAWAFAREPLYRLAPTLSAQGQLKLNIDPLPMQNLHDESLNFTLTWTLFDAGTRYGDRRLRVAQAESTALDEKALRRSVSSDVALAIAALRTARTLYKVAGDAAQLAQKNTDETQVLYAQGLAKAIEVTDANACLLYTSPSPRD